MPLDIPQNHIHRIWGEQEPKVEAERYSGNGKMGTPRYSNMPVLTARYWALGLMDTWPPYSVIR